MTSRLCLRWQRRQQRRIFVSGKPPCEGRLFCARKRNDKRALYVANGSHDNSNSFDGVCGLLRAGWARGAAEHHASFNFNQVSVNDVWFEAPLGQRIGDGFGLVREGTQEMNVFHATLFVDDDTDRDRIELWFRKNGTHVFKKIFSVGEASDANRDVASSFACRKAGFGGQSHSS